VGPASWRTNRAEAVSLNAEPDTKTTVAPTAPRAKSRRVIGRMSSET
jgi:hypothetical protein